MLSQSSVAAMSVKAFKHLISDHAETYPPLSSPSGGERDQAITALCLHPTTNYAYVTLGNGVQRVDIAQGQGSALPPHLNSALTHSH